MKGLLEAVRQAIGLNKAKGLTLIELLVAISILVILLSIAIPNYMRHQRRAMLTSYAEPIARSCIMDYATWCIENPGGQPAIGNLRNCFDTNPNDLQFTTAGGTVTLSVGNLPRCNVDGTPADHTVIARLDRVNDFEAFCQTVASSIRCGVRER